MGGLFGGGGSSKPPPVPKVPPIPTVDTDDVESQARRKRPRGRRDTFITGDLIPEPTKKPMLG